MQLLCYVICFDILHHYGVITASQICSMSRKYCAVLRNRFLIWFLPLFSVCLSVSVCLTVSVCLSIYLSTYLSISICPSVYQSICITPLYLGHKAYFYYLDYTKYRESIAIRVLRHADSKTLIFGMSVCLSVDTITQKIIELAQPNLVCDLI